ncbi:MAG: hypothetical protein QOH57_271, partial [Mycobacterium sp.]|nr:hypothetical protein [Mycobacterium sp.]
AAQLGIATALATPPPPPPAFASVADVSTLRTFSSDNTVSLSRASADTLDSVDPTQDSGLVDEEQDSVEGNVVVKDVDPLPKDEEPVLEKPVVEKVKVKDIPASPSRSARRSRPSRRPILPTIRSPRRSRTV